jgi:Uma2 family endonuclease
LKENAMPPTKLRFGPTDHGRPVTADELDDAEYADGFKYEIIDGRFYVVPVASFYEQSLERWLRRELERFSEANPDVIGWVAVKSRVFVPGRPDLTVPEPDIAVYRDDLDQLADGELNWADFHALVVVEVLVESDPDKDLVRNVDLYLQVPSIAEYWILDGRESTAEPVLIARRRYRNRWALTEVTYGETYTTRTLPGFELLIDPRR